MVPGRHTALSNDKKMVTILHRELERKVEKGRELNREGGLINFPPLKRGAY